MPASLVAGSVLVVVALALAAWLSSSGSAAVELPAAAAGPLASSAVPAVAAAPGASTPEMPLSASRPLVGTELRTALAGWVTVPGWGLAEDSNDLIGHSATISRITHPLPGEPWAITGVMRPGQMRGNAFREAGVRIERADGSALQVVVKGLGSGCLLTLNEIGADGVAGPPLQVMPLPVAAWPFRIACQRGQLRVEVGGVTLNPFPVRHATTAVGLLVQQGAVAFADLALATP